MANVRRGKRSTAQSAPLITNKHRLLQALRLALHENPIYTPRKTDTKNKSNN